MPSYRRDVGPQNKTFDTTMGGLSTEESLGIVDKETRQEAAARTHPGGGAESIDTVFPDVATATAPKEGLGTPNRATQATEDGVEAASDEPTGPQPPGEHPDPVISSQPKEGAGTPGVEYVAEPARTSGSPTAPADVNRDIAEPTNTAVADQPKEGTGTPNDDLVSANPKQQEAIDAQRDDSGDEETPKEGEGTPNEDDSSDDSDTTAAAASDDDSSSEGDEGDGDEGDGDEEPTGAEKATSGTIDDVREWVNEVEGEEREERARQAKEAEGEDGRKTLLKWLDEVAEGEDSDEE